MENDHTARAVPVDEETGRHGEEDRLILPPARRGHFALLATAFIISVCGISYELLAATVSSYFLGNAVQQYSLTIGIFLFAMGIGSYLSRKFEGNLVESFVAIEIIIGFVGGFSTFILFGAYSYTQSFSLVMYSLLLVLGTLIGLEVPILIRILRNYEMLKFSVADVLSFDYVGALIASIAFPLFVLPHMGMMHASFFYGLLNMVIVFMNLSIFSGIIRKEKMFIALSALATLILSVGLFQSNRLVSFFEARLYDDEVVLTKNTKYQRIVLSRYKDDVRLFLDGNLQFSSWDEYRYHECLVHPAMSLAARKDEVAILGGGDGLAAREVLKYPGVKRVTLVDIDADMVELCRTNAFIKELNGGSLEAPRMNVVIQDAFTYMENSRERFDVIIVDLPDPNNESLSKLYTKSFYLILKNHLSRGGMIAVQSTSPYFAREAYWCIVRTVESAGLEVMPYHTYVPSMGDWGFTLASSGKIDPSRIDVDVPTRFLNSGKAAFLFEFGRDEQEVETEINSLDTHKLLQYYDRSWKMWE
jgi:spermidine synthase